MKKAIFWDKDGTLVKCKTANGIPHPYHLTYHLNSGIEDILGLIRNKGHYLNIVVTNQPDVARGYVEKDDVEQQLFDLWFKLPIDAVYVCLHDDMDNCNCRKPQTGLLKLAAKRYGLDLTQCWVVGDTWRDVKMGVDIGCKTIFLDYNYRLPAPESPDYTISSSSNIAWELQQIFQREGVI